MSRNNMVRGAVFGLFAIPVALNVAIAGLAGIRFNSEPSRLQRWIKRIRDRLVAVLPVHLIPDIYGGVHRRIDERIPESAERKWGGWWIQTDRWNGHIERLADWLPERYVNRWLTFSIVAVGLITFAISVLLVSSSIYAVLWAVDQFLMIEFSNFGSGSPMQFGSIDISLFDIAIQLSLLVAALLAMAIIVPIVVDCVALVHSALGWLVFIPFLPGLILHELGHAIAVHQAGGRVEGVGIFTFGTFPGGAFVRPDESSLSTASRGDLFGVWAAGIGNTLLWATMLLGSAWMVVFVFNWSSAAYWLAILAMIELANAALNSLPIGPVDGGGFTRLLLTEWWGFDNMEITT